jgi:hypothetical protein
MTYTRKEIRKALEEWVRECWDDSKNENEYPSMEDYPDEESYAKDCVDCLFSYLDK